MFVNVLKFYVIIILKNVNYLFVEGKEKNVEIWNYWDGFVNSSSVNVQCCYNEFVALRREFENEFHRNRKNSFPITTESLNQNQLKNTCEQLESTRIDSEDKLPSTEEKDDDQLPDYSIYDDDVNASILKVLKNEEGMEEQTLDRDVI
jgi:hypothetical protein